MGHTQERGLPVTWDAKSEQNIFWKVPLLDSGAKVRLDHNQSSPIVFGDRLFVTLSYWPDDKTNKDYSEHHVVCFQASDGKRLWDTQVEPGGWLLSDLRGGYACPTPAADAERVYVVFGSAVIAALDRTGKIVWRKEIGPKDFDVALGASSVLFGDTVLMMCDKVDRQSSLIAFDRKTGEVKWEQKRAEVGFAHSTPVFAEIDGKAQMLVAASNSVQGLDPATGKLIWQCAAKGDTASPVFANGIVYCDSGRGGSGIAVDPTGMGDVTKTHLKWKKQIPEGFSSPIIVGDYLYRLHDSDVVTCWKLATGEQVYRERLPGLGSTAASPFATPEGRIYCASAGRSYVIEAGPQFKTLAVNDLGDPSQASPAVANGKIYLKGGKYLYCVGNK
jgi:outer membrane protein assembly factor BamB